MMRSDKFRAKMFHYILEPQQQQQHLLAFPWVDGIADYSQGKEKKKEKKVTFIVVNNNNNNNNG